MKYIATPAPIMVKLGAEEKEFTFAGFVEEALDQEQFGKGRKAMKQADKIAAAVASMNGHLVLEDEDHALLARVVDAMGYIPAIGRQLLPFADAVCEGAKSKLDG